MILGELCVLGGKSKKTERIYMLAEMTTSSYGITVAISLVGLISMYASVMTTLVLFNLRSMNQQIRSNTDDIKLLMKQKDQCRQDFVDKVDFIRSYTSIESTMKKLVESVSEIKGVMKAVEEMPKICGSVAREILKETRN
jgi:hypothetical protein